MTAQREAPTLDDTKATIRSLIASTANDMASVINAKAVFLEVTASEAQSDAALLRSGVTAYLARETRSFYARCLKGRADTGEIALAMLLAGHNRYQIEAAFCAAGRPAAADNAIAYAHGINRIAA